MKKKIKQKKKYNSYFIESFVWLAIILLFFIDRFTKELAQNKVFNTGISFSLLTNNVFFPIILVMNIILLVIIALAFFRLDEKSKKNPFLSIGFVLIISGALGNLYDRVFYGFVIDFIHISNYFPTFNCADVFNFAGVVLIIIYLIKKK